jgi:hypothetical protein
MTNEGLAFLRIFADRANVIVESRGKALADRMDLGNNRVRTHR